MALEMSETRSASKGVSARLSFPVEINSCNFIGRYGKQAFIADAVLSGSASVETAMSGTSDLEKLVSGLNETGCLSVLDLWNAPKAANRQCPTWASDAER